MGIDTRVAVISAVTALVTSGLVALLDYTVRQRDMDIKMMEMAVGLLKEDPNGPLRATREWAIDLISYYSKQSVPLPENAISALKNYPLNVELRNMISGIADDIKRVGEQGVKSDDAIREMMLMLEGTRPPSPPASR